MTAAAVRGESALRATSIAPAAIHAAAPPAPIAEDAKLSDDKYALRRAKVARAAAELSELLGFSESN